MINANTGGGFPLPATPRGAKRGAFINGFLNLTFVNSFANFIGDVAVTMSDISKIYTRIYTFRFRLLGSNGFQATFSKWHYFYFRVINNLNRL